MSQPGLHAETEGQNQQADTTASSSEGDQNSRQPLLYGSNRTSERTARINEQDPNEVPLFDNPSNTPNQFLSSGRADVDDSASAVDDDIWRKF
ncbi:MAG: hypothetical protein KAW61_00640, partial [candidate division Zixibacteria bacterium]|nr:hypothetical protein [candidate division Zixibacteria bacterium]